MRSSKLMTVSALAAALSAGPALAAEDHSHHHHHAPAQAAPEKPSSVQPKLSDAVLTTQDGKKLKLKSEVLGDKVVVMDFVYTTCTTVCPVLSALMVKLQGQLGDKASDVQLVSMTVDPARDTPARLKEYAAKYGARPGWLWLTGPTGTVNEVLKDFGAWTPNFEDHPPQVLVGDMRTGNWTRYLGFPDPKDIMAKVEELRAARAGAKSAAAK